MPSRSLVVIAHDIRSTHNVGSLLRTCEGFGVDKLYLTGYTPYPKTDPDDRLPHIAERLTRQIDKTGLGASELVSWQHYDDITDCLSRLKQDGYTIAGLEQTPTSLPLPTYQAPKRLAILLGREVEGIAPEVLSACDLTLEIPMFGKKESFNVVQAAAVALYHCRFSSVT